VAPDVFTVRTYGTRQLLGTRPWAAAPPGGHRAVLTGTAIGAGITGLVAIVAEHGNKNMVAPIHVIWVIVAVLALGAAAANRYRNAGRR
jgi:hypothetical protein